MCVQWLKVGCCETDKLATMLIHDFGACGWLSWWYWLSLVDLGFVHGNIGAVVLAVVTVGGSRCVVLTDGSGGTEKVTRLIVRLKSRLEEKAWFLKGYMRFTR